MASALLALFISPSLAGGVTSKAVYRNYWVQGTTARAVVGYMRRNPLPGDHGSAYANIRPSYGLSLATERRGSLCRVRDVTLDVRFVVTLPVGSDERRMTGSARSAWRAFASFAQQHEEAHRMSYLAHARAFVAATRGASAPSCAALRNEVRASLEHAKQAAEAHQLVFDRQESARLAGLGLFRMARN